MKFERFCEILNKHIFEESKKELLRKLAEDPNRFLGLFRPTKPKGKILQHILQSHEIKFGDAMEEVLTEIISEIGCNNLEKVIVPDIKTKKKNIDQYFTDGEYFYFIEQKVRDDHDSSKKVGQIDNFEKKLEFLFKKHGSKLIGIMYFMDPSLTKNKNFYIEELEKFKNFYGIELNLFYGRELFDYFNHPEIWENLLLWLKKWKNDLPEMPEINFDLNPKESFEEIKDLELRIWRKVFENNKLWEEGIMNVIFKTGDTLKLLLEHFDKKEDKPYKNLEKIISNRLKNFYE